METTDVLAERSNAMSLIKDSIGWIEDTYAGSSRSDSRETDLEDLEKLSRRAASVLLKVGVLGSFSSGKSTLVNALQGQLSCHHLGGTRRRPDLQYVGLLPSSPEPTTAAPTTIRPVKSNEVEDEPMLRVRFLGDEANRWTEVGEATPSRIRAYVAQDTEAVLDRRRSHIEKKIAEVEVEIPNAQIDVLLFDLPGVGSKYAKHDEIVRRCLQEADCFMYVSKATRSLGEEDLKQVRELYSHYQDKGGKPVLWVLSGIDLADEVISQNETGSATRNWMSVVQTNNSYLLEHVGSDAHGFVGSGFMGVSPIWEAQATGLYGDDPEMADELRADSRMGSLRACIDELVNGKNGRAHVHRLAREAVAIVDKYARRERERLEDEERPYVELSSSGERLQSELIELRGKGRQAGADLEEELGDRVQKVLRDHRGGGTLAEFLHDKLDDLIARTDFRKEDQLNRFEVAQIDAISEWMEAPSSPQEVWEAEYEAFRRRASETLHELAGSAVVEASGGSVDLNDLEGLVSLQAKRPDDPETLERVLGIAGKVMPLASAAATSGGLAIGLTATGAAATAGLALVPLGVALGIGGIHSLREQWQKKEDFMAQWREEERRQLDSRAEDIVDWLSVEMVRQGALIVDAVRDKVRHREDDLQLRIRRIEERLSDRTAEEDKVTIDRLSSRVAEGDRITSGLTKVLLETAN